MKDMKENPDKMHSQNEEFPYDSRQIANWFIREAETDDQSMSIMQVLKLVYIAHGWSLATLKRPLILDRIEAWDYGPVIPTVYHAFRPEGIYNLSPFYMYERKIEPIIENLLNEVYDLYKDMSSRWLTYLTCVSGGPWDIIYNKGCRFSEIPNNLIVIHYKRKLERIQKNNNEVHR